MCFYFIGFDNESMAMRKATLLLILALVMSGAEMSLGQNARDQTKRPPKEKLKIRAKEKSGPPPNARGKGTSKKKKPNSLALNNPHRHRERISRPAAGAFLLLQQMSVNTYAD